MIAGRQVVDLTQALGPTSPRSSDHPQVRIDALRWRSRHGVRTSQLTTSLHVGTHVDAPNLYYAEGATIDQVPLERLCGPAAVIDAARPDWSEITISDLEASPVPIEANDIVILRTGWHHFSGDEERYILKAPGLGAGAIDWLIDRGVKMVGADSPSPEHIFMRSRYWTELRPDVFGGVEIDRERWPRSYGHRTLMRHGICLLEGLGGDIDAIVGTRVELIVAPILVAGAEAAQARVIALR